MLTAFNLQSPKHSIIRTLFVEKTVVTNFRGIVPELLSVECLSTWEKQKGESVSKGDEVTNGLQPLRKNVGGAFPVEYHLLAGAKGDKGGPSMPY